MIGNIREATLKPTSRRIHAPAGPAGRTCGENLEGRRLGASSALALPVILAIALSLALSAGSCSSSRPPAYEMGPPSAGPRHFVLVGDTQRTSLLEFWREDTSGVAEAVLARVAEEEPAFVVHLGDLVFQGDDERHWAWFDEAARPLREKQIPCYPILGNHERYGSNRASLGHLRSRFPRLQERSWYAVKFGAVVLLLLDSNFGELSDPEIAEQSEWYGKQLQRCEEDASVAAVIVCAHHPPFTRSTVVSPDAKVKELFAEPFLRKEKTRIFFSGHAHTYERFQLGGKQFVVSGGGGGPRHKLDLAAGTGPRDEYQGGAIREFHFCKVHVRGSVLEVEMVRLDLESFPGTSARAPATRPALPVPRGGYPRWVPQAGRAEEFRSDGLRAKPAASEDGRKEEAGGGARAGGPDRPEGVDRPAGVSPAWSVGDKVLIKLGEGRGE